MIKVIFLSSVFVLLNLNNLFAHGVLGEIGKGGIVVIAKYDTGESMSYAKVKIIAPDGKPFQTGRTDRNGRFCFFPDEKGKWKIIVDDEIGHLLEMNVVVKEGMKIELIQKKAEDRRYEKAIVGISLIFGIAGIISFLKVRKLSK